MSEMIIIGVDHGYAAMKTAHFTFPTGLVEYEHETLHAEECAGIRRQIFCGGQWASTAPAG